MYEISMAVVYWFCIVRQSEEVPYAECPEWYCPQQSTRGPASSAPIENVSHATDAFEIRFFDEKGAKIRKFVLNVCNFLDEKGTVYKCLHTAENNNNGRPSVIGPHKGRRLGHYKSKNCFTN